MLVLEYPPDKQALLLFLQLISEFPALKHLLIKQAFGPLPEQLHDRLKNKGPQPTKCVKVQVSDRLVSPETLFRVL